MPGIDGHRVAREIRRLQTAPLPLLVAITALTSPAEQAKSVRAGFNYHFAKPADLRLVLTAIVAHMRPGATDDP
jgi:CheY-like chemotaxis protein